MPKLTKINNFNKVPKITCDQSDQVDHKINTLINETKNLGEQFNQMEKNLSEQKSPKVKQLKSYKSKKILMFLVTK